MVSREGAAQNREQIFMSKLKRHLILIIMRAAGRMPLQLAQRLGRWGGRLAWRLNGQARKTTETNIKLCMGELTRDEQRQLSKRSLMHTGMTVLEVPLIWEWPIDRCLALIKETQGLSLLDEALKSGKGVILLAPHLGNWELTGLYFSSHYKMAALYSPPRISEFEDYMVRVRGKQGSELVRGDHRGLGRLVGILREGGVAGILPDQSPSRNKSNVFAPFFNNNVRTMTLVNKLIRKTQATALVTYAERLDKSKGFRIIVRKADPGIGDADALTGATALNHSIEQMVRMAPTQYQWEYKRFRHIKDQPNPYQ